LWPPSAAKVTSLALIANHEVVGDLVDNERFAGAYRSPLRSPRSSGAGATMETEALGPCLAQAAIATGDDG
jgi:hypothetical protein